MAGQDTANAPAATTGEATLLDRLGGEATIVRWVDRFYDLIAADALLAPLFTRDLAESKARQAAFFVEFFGGPPRYSQQYGRPFMRFKHRHVRIGQAERDAWMRLVMQSLTEVVDDPAVRAEAEGRLATMADRMVNHHPDKRDAYYFN